MSKQYFARIPVNVSVTPGGSSVRPDDVFVTITGNDGEDIHIAHRYASPTEYARTKAIKEATKSLETDIMQCLTEARIDNASDRFLLVCGDGTMLLVESRRGAQYTIIPPGKPEAGASVLSPGETVDSLLLSATRHAEQSYGGVSRTIKLY